ncbi:MAG: alanine racemase [bacterium]
MKTNIAEINLRNLCYNVETIRSYIGPYTKFLAVVKADAYGHGIREIAHALSGIVDSFGVSNIEEAIELREIGISEPILILGDVSPSGIKEIVQFSITPSVSSIDFARLLSKEGKVLGKVIPIHIQIDTGMGRFGILPEETNRFLEDILSFSNLKLEGIFSHFSTAGTDREFVDVQFRRFVELISLLERRRIYFSIRHIANSAGVLFHPYTVMDMVRVGIAMYGINPSNEPSPINLKPVMSLKSRILSIRDLPKDWPVGYDATYRSKENSKIGIVPIGYGDGLPYQLSNNGYVLVKGKKVPIVGRICMDYTIIDLSEVPEVQIGDEVVIIGEQEGEIISALDLAKLTHQIPYSVITNLKGRIQKQVIEK